MDNIKTYEAVFNETDNTGVFGISLVERPAMEGNFIALSKHEPLQFKDVDKEQRKVVGLVLQPDKLILRFDEKKQEEYNIVLRKDTIKNLSYNFFKQNFQKNSTIEHDRSQKIEGVTFVESWLVEDIDKDKQALYGFSYPVGSWLAVLKIDNNDIWENYVKTGKVLGFSIDGFLDLKEINNNEINMSEVKEQTGVLSEIRDLFKTAFSKKEEEVKESPKEVKLGMIKTANGEITIEYDGEVLEAGISASIVAEEGEKIPVPVGTHELEEGVTIVVSEEGIIGEVQTPSESAPEEAPEVVEQSEDAQDSKIAKEIESAIKSILIKYTEQDSKIKELEDRVLELSKEPVAKTIKAIPTSGKNLTLTQRINNKLN